MISPVDAKINGRIGEQMVRMTHGPNAVVAIEVDHLVIVKVQIRISRTVYNMVGLAVHHATHKEVDRLK